MDQERDFEEYPDNASGNALWQMATGDIDLVSLRVIDFEHCFPDESSAREFLAAVAETVFNAKLKLPAPESNRGWEVQCKVRLIPTYAAITQTEDRLAATAQRFGGYPDGWGTMSRPNGSPRE